MGLAGKNKPPVWHLAFLFLALMPSCTRKSEPGYLKVAALSEGKYEIYRVALEAPLQFVSEQVGEYNHSLALAPGKYLVLADCSYETIAIEAGKTAELTADRVRFIPPNQPQPGDHFSIQCSRYEETRSRQNIEGRFELNVLKGRHDVLVGLVPLTIDKSRASSTPVEHAYTLSALQVTSVNPKLESTPYFVSPINEILSSTQSQSFGRWEYLLPGKYRIEVNGTSLNVDLKPADLIQITPAFLRVSAPSGVDLSLSSQIRGTPHYFTINEDHIFYFQEYYPVLPGQLQLSIDGSFKSTPVEAVAGQLMDLKTKSLLINRNCSPWEWDCLGGQEVQLFDSGESSPFAQGITDVPILYLGDDVEFSLQSTREIHVKIPNTSIEAEYKVEVVHFVPQPSQHPGLITDLVRIESSNPAVRGHSSDLPLDELSTLTLVEGSYMLAQYTSSMAREGSRSRADKPFGVVSGGQLEVSFPSYLSERKLALYHKKQLHARKAQRGGAQRTFKKFL